MREDAKQERQSRWAPRQVATARAFVLAVITAAACAGLYFTALAPLSPPRHEHLALVPLVGLGVWGAMMQRVAVRDRRFSLAVALDGIPVLVGAVFLPPGLVMLAFCAAVAAAQAQHGKALGKTIASALSGTLALGLALLFYRETLGHSLPVSAWGWFASAGMLALFGLTSLVLAVSTGAVINWRLMFPPVRAALLQSAMEIAICTGGGLVAVYLGWANAWALGLFAAMVAVADLGWRRWARAQQRHDLVQKLYGFTTALANVEGGEHDVVRAVLEEARTLLAASRAVLMAPLDPPLEHLALRCSVDSDGPADFKEAVPLGELAALVGERGPLLLSRQSGDPRAAMAMAAEGVTEAVAVPLRTGGPASGYILVAERAFSHEGFSPADVQLLGALAGNAEGVLRRSGLLEKLRREAAVRQHEAHHDNLTGLPNRAAFSERLDAAIETGGDQGRVALILLDLDGFKQINDTLGHNIGDVILGQVAARLAPLNGDKSLVARLGGDEFVLLLEDAPDDAGCLAVAERALASVNQTMTVEKFELAVRASLGVASSPAGRTTPGALLSHADIAMYKAKADGGGVRVYDAATDRTTLRRLSLATELRKAIEAGGLKLHYQPVLDVASGDVIGCEALTRWAHEHYGAISPDEFIPVAEKAGLIDPLTWWVLETALDQLRSWRSILPDLSMSVNVSARSLMTPRLADRVEEALWRAELRPEVLRLELTETSMMAELGEQALHSLSSLGVALSIDDFGTGYSSLTRLRQLPFDEVKIDRSFVSHMCRAGDDEAVVRSVIELARGLDKIATAEGVEDHTTLRRLADLGCHSAQGFYLSRPLPAVEMESLLVAHSARRANGDDGGHAEAATGGKNGHGPLKLLRAPDAPALHTAVGTAPED